MPDVKKISDGGTTVPEFWRKMRDWTAWKRGLRSEMGLLVTMFPATDETFRICRPANHLNISTTSTHTFVSPSLVTHRSLCVHNPLDAEHDSLRASPGRESISFWRVSWIVVKVTEPPNLIPLSPTLTWWSSDTAVGLIITGYLQFLNLISRAHGQNIRFCFILLDMDHILIAFVLTDFRIAVYDPGLRMSGFQSQHFVERCWPIPCHARAFENEVLCRVLRIQLSFRKRNLVIQWLFMHIRYKNYIFM